MNLDFTNSDTSYFTHGFHTYPAKMIPQVANVLLDEFGKKSKLVFDPYCGSGTTLVEANTHGVNAIGSDLNPLARLIAKVKTTPIELQTLDLHLKDFYNYLFRFRFNLEINDESIVSPTFPNINFWFSKGAKNDLSIILNFISKIENSNVQDFFKVAFSQTIRECSWTRKNEFKLYKMSADHIKMFKPDAISMMEKILGKNRNGLKDFMQKRKARTRSTICDFNSVFDIPKSIISNNSVDLVLTSPPYGDSHTTVAYGQFSALANQWLGFLEKGRALDSALMGGVRRDVNGKFESKVLNSHIKKIAGIDAKRAQEVYSFYHDYQRSIANVAQTVKKKGYVCYVVSNRNVKGVTLKTDVITKDFFQCEGFKHIDTLKRKISSKRMPRQNSPRGKSGEKVSLMNSEYIVIMQKK